MNLKESFVDILCCPICGKDLVADDEGNFLICRQCSVKFPIKDGIPILLAEEKIEMKENGA